MREAVLGFQQLSAAELAAAIAPTIPAGTRTLLCQAESANVRYRNDGTDPTAAIGMIVLSGAHQPHEIPITGFPNLKFILESGSPKLNITYYGQAANVTS